MNALFDLLIFINTILVLLGSVIDPVKLEKFSNTIMIILLIQMFAKILKYGKSYFKGAVNVFEFVIIWISIAEIILQF